MTIFKFALLRNVRTPTVLVANWVAPLLIMLLPGLWNEAVTETGVWTFGLYLLAMQIMISAATLGRRILSDRVEGTIYRILSCPVTMLSYFTQNLLAIILPLFVQIVVMVFLGKIMHSWEMTFSLLLILCYTVFAVASVAASFAWSCLFKSRSTSSATYTLVVILFGTVGGFWMPLSILPNYIRYLGMLFPPYWISNSIYTLQSVGLTRDYWISLLAMLLFATIYLLFGGKRRIV